MTSPKCLELLIVFLLGILIGAGWAGHDAISWCMEDARRCPAQETSPEPITGER